MTRMTAGMCNGVRERTKKRQVASGSSSEGHRGQRPLSPHSKLIFYSRRNLKELVTTVTELMAMVMAARAGLRVQPVNG